MYTYMTLTDDSKITHTHTFPTTCVRVTPPAAAAAAVSSVSGGERGYIFLKKPSFFLDTIEPCVCVPCARARHDELGKGEVRASENSGGEEI